MTTKELAKRLFDIAMVLLSVPLSAPLILLAGIVIALETPGGMFFTQQRCGQHGKPFKIYKLRTMVKNAEFRGAGLYAESNDSRFTRCGILARRYSVDELPQLINVFRGEMSIVGPRPQLLQIVELYQDDFDTILQVKPGLTGLVQILGRNALPRSTRIKFDKQYVNDWSLLGDIWIILKTLKIVLTGEGQLNDQGREDVER